MVFHGSNRNHDQVVVTAALHRRSMVFYMFEKETMLQLLL